MLLRVTSLSINRSGLGIYSAATRSIMPLLSRALTGTLAGSMRRLLFRVRETRREHAAVTVISQAPATAQGY